MKKKKKKGKKEEDEEEAEEVGRVSVGSAIIGQARKETPSIFQFTSHPTIAVKQ
jgi:hypothetical protein